MQAVKNQAECNLANNMNMINKDFQLYMQKRNQKREIIYMAQTLNKYLVFH